MNRKKWTSIFMVICAIFALAGCRPAAQQSQYRPTGEGTNKPGQVRTPPAEETPSPQEAQNIPKHAEQQRELRAPQQAQRPQTYNAAKQADEIAQVLTGIPGVERAYVLLTGRIALVGVDLKADISGSKIDTVKYSVKEAAERTGPGYKAVVTADVDTVTRIRELANGARNGRPISSLADEIADILSRLYPET